MKLKLFAAALLGVLTLNLAGTAFADVKSKKALPKNSDLLRLMPEVDAVAIFDAKRFFSAGLPQLFSANQPILDEILRSSDELRSKVGIDLRQFETVTVGATVRPGTAAGKYSFDTVFAVRSAMNAADLLAAGKLAANGKYREEKIGERSVYIFQTKEIAAEHGSKVPSVRPETVDSLVNKVDPDIAVTVFDDKTLLAGDLEMVKNTLAGTSKADPVLTKFLTARTGRIFSFASKVPAGFEALVPLDNDEMAKNLRSIRYLFGGFDINTAGVAVDLAARTATAADAKELGEMLGGLRMLGSSLLSSSTTPELKIASRVVDTAKIVNKGSEVSIDLNIAQADVDVLIAKLKLTATGSADTARTADDK